MENQHRGSAASTVPNISPFKGTFEDDFPFPQVGFVSSLEGMCSSLYWFWYSETAFHSWLQSMTCSQPRPNVWCSDYGKMGKDFQDWVPWVDKNSISFFFGVHIFERRFLGFGLDLERGLLYIFSCATKHWPGPSIWIRPLERANSLDFHSDFYSTTWISSRFVGRSCIIKVWFCRSRSTKSNTSALFGQWHHIIPYHII